MSARLVIGPIAALAVMAAACQAPVPRPGDPALRCGDEIVVCGERFHAGTPVVLWTDPGGYDAYRVEPRFAVPVESGSDPPPDGKARYHTWRRGLDDATRARIERDGWTVADLAAHVRWFVVHYDVAGTARQCFKVLQDRRGLSVHFLLDVDGTIYQTLDLKERAWHAGDANDRSIGIEIAHIGAYPAPGHDALRTWYAHDQRGPRVTFPKWLTEPGVRAPDFEARPARVALVEGKIHGQRLWQYDFTPEQYAALARLLAALHRVLGLPLDAPRDPAGLVRTGVLTDPERDAFHGVLGHFHLTTNKTDPGPAFDWDRVLDLARTLVPGRPPG